MSSGLPFGKFFWSDYASDPALKICSLAAQGLWMRMLCIAAEHQPVGYVAINGEGLGQAEIAALAGAPSEYVSELLAELERRAVFSRNRNGWIYSRRMVRDAKRARNARENGKKGGNPSLSKQRGNQAQDNQEDKGQDKPHIPESRVQKKRENKSLSTRAMPDWLPMAEWRGFEEMRRKIKKPMTARAVGMAITKLDELRQQGESPARVLDQSTMHCWQDLYPVREAERAGGQVIMPC